MNPRHSSDAQPTEHEDERGIYYITAGGQRYRHTWCHDCGGEGCDYCEGVGQIRVDDDTAGRTNHSR